MTETRDEYDAAQAAARLQLAERRIRERLAADGDTRWPSTEHAAEAAAEIYEPAIAALKAERAKRDAATLRLIRDLADPDPCWFDHHGGYQAHGYLSLSPGEKCPQQEAKELLAEQGSDHTDE